MTEQLNQVIIEYPPWEVVSMLGQSLKERENGLSEMHLVAEDSALMEIINTCLDNTLGFTVSPKERQHPGSGQPPAQTDRSPNYVNRPVGIQQDPITTRPLGARLPESDGGGSVDSRSLLMGSNDLPVRGEYRTTDDWLSSTANYFGIEFDAFRDIVRTYCNGVDVDQKRRILELAFSHHLEREPKGEHAYVDVRITDSQTTSRYHYLDNGPGRGGAHYFERLTPQLKAEITYHATSEDLTVLAEGDGFVSVSFGKPAVKDDIRFTEGVISHVFGASMADIARIDEVIDRDETCTWFA